MASWTYHSVANLPAVDDVLNMSVGPTPVSMTTATPSESHVARMLWTFAAPFIFCTGVVGNILILLVMGRRRLRGTTTSLYLRAMALGDLCALVTGIIPEWLEATDFVVFKELHPVTCKLEKFSFFTCGDTAIWILVVFTVDRFIAVAFPLCKKHMCLYGRARIYCLLTVFAAAAKNAHVFWTRGAEYDVISDGNRTVLVSNCGRPPPYAHFERFVRPWIAFAIISVIPFAVLLFCNTWIIKVLLDVKRMREKQPLAGRGKDKALVQMTAMCLSASFCFLLCIAPSIVLLIGRPYWTSSEHPNSVYFICKSVSNQLVYVNHSANFFLYCLTGRRFRQELVLLCACKRSYGAAASASDSKATLYKFTTNLNRNNAHKGAIRGDIIHMKVRRI